MPAILPKLRLTSDTYDDKSYTDVNRLAVAMQTQAEMLSPIVTRLYGDLSNEFPLLLATEGKNRIRKVRSMDGQYTLPVIGRPKKSSAVVRTIATPQGAGRMPFQVSFKDRHFGADHDIESSSGVLCKVQSQPIQQDGGWSYTLKVLGGPYSQSVPASDLMAGKKWANMFANVGISGSRGNESRNFAPGKMTNQTNLIRKSYAYKGNVENKVMVVSIPTSTGVKKYWTEWEAHLRGLMWKQECEQVLWYSQYNRQDDGSVIDIDINSGEVILMGSGMEEQIVNKSSYSYFTEKKLSGVMRDVFFNSVTTDKKKIDIYVGTGSREEMDRAMKNSMKGFALVDSKFVSGSGNDMVYGSYFSTYRHVDGHEATVKHLPMLDRGSRADKAERHPITGLPITSYDMYFIDMSTVEGEPNIQYVAEEGREEIEFAVPGVSIPKGFASSQLRASDIDASSVHYMKSLGVYMKNPINSFKMSCDLS